MKYLYHTIKWSTILAIVLSIWIVAAWLKADLKPDLIQPIPTHRVVEIVAQKPTSGQEWAIKYGVPVRYLSEADRRGSNAKRISSQGIHSESKPVSSEGGLSSGQATDNQSGDGQSGVVLPLGKFLVPSGGRDPIYVIPELDPVSGETKLRAQPAGGFARFGGERYAFADLLYQWQQFNFPDAPEVYERTRSLSQYGLNIGIHQGLGRIGKVELMAEGWVGLGKQSFDLGLSDWSVQAGGKLRLALPF